MTPITFTQNNVSVTSAFVNPLFSGMRNRARESFATWAGAKQKPVHCSGPTARKMNDGNVDEDYHATPPPKYQVGGDCKRENLGQQDSERVTRMTPGASSSGQLEAAGASSSGSPVATEDSSSEKKDHTHPCTDGDKYIRKFDDPAKDFDSAE